MSSLSSFLRYCLALLIIRVDCSKSWDTGHCQECSVSQRERADFRECGEDETVTETSEEIGSGTLECVAPVPDVKESSLLQVGNLRSLWNQRSGQAVSFVMQNQMYPQSNLVEVPSQVGMQVAGPQVQWQQDQLQQPMVQFQAPANQLTPAAEQQEAMRLIANTPYRVPSNFFNNAKTLVPRPMEGIFAPFYAPQQARPVQHIQENLAPASSQMFQDYATRNQPWNVQLPTRTQMSLQPGQFPQPDLVPPLDPLPQEDRLLQVQGQPMNPGQGFFQPSSPTMITPQQAAMIQQQVAPPQNRDPRLQQTPELQLPYFPRQQQFPQQPQFQQQLVWKGTSAICRSHFWKAAAIATWISFYPF